MAGPSPSSAPSWSLSEAEREVWQRDGFFIRVGVFAADELLRLREAAEAIAAEAQRAVLESRDRYAIDGNPYVEVDLRGTAATVQLEHREGSRTIRVIEPVHSLHPALEELVDDARVVAPMRDLVGSEQVAIFTDKMNLKRPRDGSGFQWHQDSPYWAHFCAHLDRLPNVLVALDDARHENGCFRVIRGSHLEGPLPGREGEGRLGPLFTHPDVFDEADQVLAEVAAGSLVFFSPHTVHGSEPNRSDRARRALVLTYQPAGERMFKVDRIRNAGGAA